MGDITAEIAKQIKFNREKLGISKKELSNLVGSPPVRYQVGRMLIMLPVSTSWSVFAISSTSLWMKSTALGLSNKRWRKS